MPDLQKAKDALAKAEAALADLRTALTEDRPATDNAPTIQATPSPNLDDQVSFEDLKQVLESDRWPICANKNLICDPNNDSDKTQRGRGVVELMVEGDVTDKKFLDFGCGEGHSAAYVATKKASLSVGYDIAPKNWEKLSAPNLNLTDKWDEVVKNAPYDFILVFDVIDHLVGTTPVDVLTKVKSVLADDGRIFLRTHPYTSRHALHNYHDLNKGYIQLVFTPEELAILLKDAAHIEPNNGVKFPLATYKGYFDQVGLEIVNHRPVKDSVDVFYRAPAITNRIMKNLGVNQYPEFQMSMAFIDYVIKKPS